ncbi:TPR repeat-containing protein 2 [Elsinoe australis]|uniref:TPR repeat-containing protein 2 n=1 Tax=Elsinoe australis TaxID=40998 RepID=A0A4U7AT72_9PEZI|nr:TPR repeat-containing protein 2 [Elsinoe australis]
MSEALVSLFRESLPTELQSLLEDQLTSLGSSDFTSIFQTKHAHLLFGHDQIPETANVNPEDFQCWTDYIFRRLSLILSAQQEDSRHSPEYLRAFFFLLGHAALLSFLQSNFTGPPLPFSPANALLTEDIANDSKKLAETRTKLVESLTVDGVAAYKLTPNVELLCLADTIFSCPPIKKNIPLVCWAQLRTSFIHQRILSEQASTLQEQIYNLLGEVQNLLDSSQSVTRDAHVGFLLEKSSVETYYSNDRLARTDIDQAARERKFLFAITGRLGKRTKWQEKDTSQLVVLAKSQETSEPTATQNGNGTSASAAPKKLDLNDDTLLESISFATLKGEDPAKVIDESSLPTPLAELDPASQPLLQPLDSVILLSLASAITNTSPADGLTREETLPYANRVLEGGSSNWQIYTQALLVRSRIEGYKSRTTERGLLQLQALVDQVIVDTTPSSSTAAAPAIEQSSTSFLPRPSDKDSAPASERLQYVFPLAVPARWDLESELAQRWVSLGGLRSALEIYERLELWAEAALCWAATEREDKARAVVRRLLYLPTPGVAEDAEDQKFEGHEKEKLPADAARLFCILGDIDQNPAMYERAWEVSGNRYARAQRSLGRMWFTKRDYLKAAEAYSRSLNVNKLNHGSWFALGCALLELEEYGRAVEAFTRCVQLDERDAEAWSNLAAAILRDESGEDATVQPPSSADEDLDSANAPAKDPQKHKRDALRALKRAASLKHDSYRIWENVLIVAASLDPPELSSAIAAQSRVIDLRGSTDGEKCVDADIMALIVRQVVASSCTGESYDASRPGPERMLVELFDRKIQPLITSSYALWSLVAKLALWRKKPSSALEAHEKAWRTVTAQPGWENEEGSWNRTVEATIELCDAYESLGPMDRTEGLGAGDGQVVAKDWRFKARSAVRTILGKGKATWEDSEGWERLQGAMEGLKA